MNSWIRAIGGLTCMCAVAPAASASTIYCTLTNFTVAAYDNGGVYLHGDLNGVHVDFINVCGATTSGQQDCVSKATERRLALALSAQAVGKSLRIGFRNLTACSQFQSYMIPADLRIGS